MNLKNLGPTVARVLLGLSFFVFGLNFFINFLPHRELPEGALKLMTAMAASGYLLTFVKITEVAVGALLLANRLVPLALTILAPVMLNIVAFHIFMEGPATLPVPLILFGLMLYLAWVNRAAYAGLFASSKSRVTAGASVGSPAAA